MAKFCSECGSRLIEGEAFCNMCGAPTAPQAQHISEGPQKVAVQPQPAYRQQGGQGTNDAYALRPEPNKKNTALIVLTIVLAVAVLAGGAFELYWFVLRKPGGEAKDQPSVQTPTSVIEKSEPPSANTDYDGNNKPADAAVNDSTEEDFGWISGVTGPPSGAEILTDPDEVSGRWKAYIDYQNSDAREYALIDISAEGGRSSIDWRILRIDYDGTGFRNGPDKVYTLEGNFDEGYISALGEIRGDLTINCFYHYGSNQYALGEIINPSGDVGVVYLVR